MSEKKTYKLQGKTASIERDFCTGDMTIYIPDGIGIHGKYKARKILITEEALEDYGKVSPSGTFIIDIKNGSTRM